MSVKVEVGAQVEITLDLGDALGAVAYHTVVGRAEAARVARRLREAADEIEAKIYDERGEYRKV